MILGAMGDGGGLLSGPNLMGGVGLTSVTSMGTLSLGPPSPNLALPSFGFTQEQVNNTLFYNSIIINYCSRLLSPQKNEMNDSMTKNSFK